MRNPILYKCTEPVTFSLTVRTVMSLFSTLCVVCVTSFACFVFYIATYNRNMSLFVNLYSFGMYVYTRYMLGECVSVRCHHP